MKLGLFMMPLHPSHRLMHEIIEENADKIIHADQIGFDEAWVGEHFSATTEPLSAPMMFMASLLRQTKNIVFGTGVVSLPNHHPAIVAAEAAQFDHLSRGRFIFGIGPSGLASDHELFGNTDMTVRNERMAESIETILKIWGQDPPYDIKGKHWHVKITDAIVPELGVGYMPKPYQKPHPPIAMSAMSPHSSSVKTAALRGWGPISANFCPEYVVASHWGKYVEGCREAGREPTGQDWRVARNILVAESDQQALDWAMDPKGSNHYYFRYLWEVLKRANYTVVMKSDPAMPDEAVTVEGLIESMMIYGSSRTVTEKLLAFRERVGPFSTLLMASMDGSGANRHREWETMRRLATEVLPRVREATRRAPAMA
ncbi:LLM class flavin-dependent oxidoreductase [Rhodovarius lipocyclicus]|uniref:LLM class flavin-dependent oxidoreductase n=1 Tax=Rhodovarius lipocyclicus TaxID=268410 RepID=UPI00135B2EDD|nr:LLM class flavin-dependent oxidoreductase [Rhodovarius lipocyclicus]